MYMCMYVCVYVYVYIALSLLAACKRGCACLPARLNLVWYVYVCVCGRMRGPP